MTVCFIHVYIFFLKSNIKLSTPKKMAYVQTVLIFHLTPGIM